VKTLLLLIDIGNTTITIGLSNRSSIEKIYKLNTEKSKSSDEYAVTLNIMLKDTSIQNIIISSVVPELNDVFREYFQNWFDITPLFLGQGVKTGIRINSDNPKEVGSDLIANVIGATAGYSPSCLVVDLGTATTFTYVDNLNLKGVIITAGITTSKNALISKTSLLPQVELEIPSKLLGTNTVDCIKSGIVYGHASMIDGMTRKIKKHLNNDLLPVILTGGHSKLILPLLEEKVIYDERLLLKGLLEVYHRNFMGEND
jgi:type III pantothenate kinase